MQNRNLPFIVGLVITLLFIGLAAFGPLLAPADPLQQFSDVITVGEETYIPTVRPIPPFELAQFPLGTDHVGRDLFSRLLWAIRPTLLACFGVVLARLLIGLPLGMIAGWYQNSWVETAVDALIGLLVALPALILALSLIALSEGRPLSLFIVVLALIGWPDMAQFFKTQTAGIKQQDYIESAYALGSSTPAVWWRHVLPQFLPTLPTIIVFELSAALLLMAELGFLGAYIGNGMVVFAADPNSAGQIAVGLTSEIPELGQMLSDFTRKMFQAPWEMVIAASAIFLQVFGFNMLGEGLRRRLKIRR